MTVAVLPHGEQLVVGLAGWDAVYALRRRLKLPLSAVTAVRVAPAAELTRQRPTRCVSGALVPAAMTIGTYEDAEPDANATSRREFWCVRLADRLLVIDLAPGEPYTRLVLELRAPDEALAELTPLVGAAE